MLHLPTKNDLLECDCEIKRLSNHYHFVWYHPTRCFDYNIIFKNLYGLLPQGGYLLDAGGGQSFFPLYLAIKGYKVLIQDLKKSHEGYEGVKNISDFKPAKKVIKDFSLGNNVSYTIEDLLQFKKDNNFDAIVCASAIEHFSNKKEKIRDYFNKIISLTRKGGHIFITTDVIKANRGYCHVNSFVKAILRKLHLYPKNWGDARWVFGRKDIEEVFLKNFRVSLIDFKSCNQKQQIEMFRNWWKEKVSDNNTNWSTVTKFPGPETSLFLAFKKIKK